MPLKGIMDGQRVGLIYAQVGLFRKWLGDKLHWWMGEHDEMQGAYTYAATIQLSAQIWHTGYSVDEVGECMVKTTSPMTSCGRLIIGKALKAMTVISSMISGSGRRGLSP
jgi:hypothetical protein